MSYAFVFCILCFNIIKTVNVKNGIQINQPARCNNFSSLLLDVYVQLNMFRASLRPKHVELYINVK
jgi:hypothetical protein